MAPCNLAISLSTQYHVSLELLPTVISQDELNQIPSTIPKLNFLSVVDMELSLERFHVFAIPKVW